MKFIKLTGNEANKDVSKYRMKWEKKSRSKFQEGVKFFLQPFWRTHVIYEEFPVVGTKMTLDIVNLTRKIALEIQGAQHSEFNEFFHNGNKGNYYAQLQRDVEKRRWCELNGLRLVEIYPSDLPLTKEFLEKHDLI
jgi:hypothetical protein